MKAPTLPIRLNKQLSGGYEPHLLWQTEKMSKNEVSSRVTLWADKRSDDGDATNSSDLMRGMSWMVQQDLGNPGRGSSSVHVRL